MATCTSCHGLRSWTSKADVPWKNSFRKIPSLQRMHLAPVFLAIKDVALGEKNRLTQLQFFVNGLWIKRRGEVDFQRHVRAELTDADDAMAPREQQVQSGLEMGTDVLV